MAISQGALQKALLEVEAALSPLPEGYWVKPSEDGNAIIVGCNRPAPDGLGFAITGVTICDGLHVQAAVENFTGLMQMVETGGRTDGAAINRFQ